MKRLRLPHFQQFCLIKRSPFNDHFIGATRQIAFDNRQSLDIEKRLYSPYAIAVGRQQETAPIRRITLLLMHSTRATPPTRGVPFKVTSS
jgi:hypothetical protein